MAEKINVKRTICCLTDLNATTEKAFTVGDQSAHEMPCRRIEAAWTQKSWLANSKPFARHIIPREEIESWALVRSGRSTRCGNRFLK